MASSPLYAQHPLQHGQIRVLERNPFAQDGLEFIFKIIQLDYDQESRGLATIDRYFALSYTWGSDSASHRVTIDGYDFLVRDNLWQFLQQWYKSDSWKGEIFWIDAVCIDQLDKAEKNVQVGMMGRIYNEACLKDCKTNIDAF